MDKEFNQRWQTATAPFDGVTLTLEDFVPLVDLRQMLIPIVNLLSDLYGDAKLFKLSDWHQHDGYVNHADVTTWDELRSFLLSEETLNRMSAGETHVRLAFFTEHRDFLLRVYIPDIYDSPHHEHDDPRLVLCGMLDFTSDEALALRISDAVLEESGSKVKTNPAKAFFDKAYAG